MCMTIANQHDIQIEVEQVCWLESPDRLMSWKWGRFRHDRAHSRHDLFQNDSCLDSPHARVRAYQWQAAQRTLYFKLETPYKEFTLLYRNFVAYKYLTICGLVQICTCVVSSISSISPRNSTSFWLLVTGQYFSTALNTGSASLGSLSTNCRQNLIRTQIA